MAQMAEKCRENPFGLTVQEDNLIKGVFRKSLQPRHPPDTRMLFLHACRCIL